MNNQNVQRPHVSSSSCPRTSVVGWRIWSEVSQCWDGNPGPTTWNNNWWSSADCTRTDTLRTVGCLLLFAGSNNLSPPLSVHSAFCWLSPTLVASQWFLSTSTRWRLWHTGCINRKRHRVDVCRLCALLRPSVCLDTPASVARSQLAQVLTQSTGDTTRGRYFSPTAYRANYDTHIDWRVPCWLA